MKKNLYSIKDSKAGYYNTPFDATTDVDATRQLARAANDQSTTIAAFPAEFELYRIGVFESESGKIEQADTHYFICSAASLVKKNSGA